MMIVLFEIVGLVVVDEIGLRRHGLFGIEVGGQKLVFDINEFESLFGGSLIDRSHAGNVIADVANLVGGEGVLVVADGKNAVRIGGVFADGDADDAVELLGA